MSTYTENHLITCWEIYDMLEHGQVKAAAQLIADSEARATAELLQQVANLKYANHYHRKTAETSRATETDRNNLRADLDAIKAILSEEKARAERAEAELSAEQEKCDKLLSVLVYADQILDDIDTCSDAHKPMYSTYSQNVFKLCIKGRDARRAAIDAAMKTDHK